MALRALLFSKNPETADSLTPVLKEAGIRTELCKDIFSAMEKGTKQPFSCVIVDWSEQPEAGFLLKRARESGVNRSAVVVAIVDGDPSPDEEREHRLEFLIYRPIVADEARAVLAKACQRMQLHSAAYIGDERAALDQPEIQEPSEPQPEDPNLVPIASELPESLSQSEYDDQGEQTIFVEPSQARSWSMRTGFGTALAAALLLAAAFFFWRSHDAFQYLATTPEGTFHVLRECVAEIFYANRSGAQPVGTVMTDAQQDAYFARPPANPKSPSAPLGVVAADINLPDVPLRLRPAFDFPLPSPALHVDPVPARPIRAAVPDSIKSSAPVARPVAMAVNPQMLPVSAPPPTSSPAWQQAGEPVHLSEESARALLIQPVNPAYPPEAMAQKLQGPVILQVMIGRDGTVQELKLVRGYFVFAKAAIAAVKQWRFRPYIVNGRALGTQTVITINFTYPPS